ncbi:26219_t:CDS:1, partial [Gigaspora margarita]
EEINLISNDDSQVSKNKGGNSSESEVNHINDDEYTGNNSEDDDYASENGSHYISNGEDDYYIEKTAYVNE